MNLLENYLVKVIEVEPCNEEWTKEDWAKNKEWLCVTATFNCYGREQTHKREYTKDEWQKIVDKGYYMG